MPCRTEVAYSSIVVYRGSGGDGSGVGLDWWWILDVNFCTAAPG